MGVNSKVIKVTHAHVTTFNYRDLPVSVDAHGKIGYGSVAVAWLNGGDWRPGENIHTVYPMLSLVCIEGKLHGMPWLYFGRIDCVSNSFKFDKINPEKWFSVFCLTYDNPISIEECEITIISPTIQSEVTRDTMKKLLSLQ